MHEHIEIILFILITIYALIILHKLIIFGHKLLELGHKAVDIWKSRQVNTKQQIDYGQIERNIDRSVEHVNQLPIEIIAPNIKNPPRSPGGFGSRVSDK